MAARAQSVGAAQGWRAWLGDPLPALLALCLLTAVLSARGLGAGGHIVLAGLIAAVGLSGST